MREVKKILGIDKKTIKQFNQCQLVWFMPFEKGGQE